MLCIGVDSRRHCCTVQMMVVFYKYCDALTGMVLIDIITLPLPNLLLHIALRPPLTSCIHSSVCNNQRQS